MNIDREQDIIRLLWVAGERVPKSTWHTIQPGLQRRRRADFSLAWRVRFKSRVYPVTSNEEGCELLKLLNRYRSDASGAPGGNTVINLT